ncbi:hypothetical protein SKAU_G00318700 [Synaphobranchus kaupii]|uniref:Uncharacterized protein n=1 Tax=Synaphobranchus kaupii TaxID=118154 RepID=A0A9Q1ET46_SYNKA|nr:hypothetical protein SKAU_G00318700 [Synaphobranchus kaupii]
MQVNEHLEWQPHCLSVKSNSLQRKYEQYLGWMCPTASPEQTAVRRESVAAAARRFFGNGPSLSLRSPANSSHDDQ